MRELYPQLRVVVVVEIMVNVNVEVAPFKKDMYDPLCTIVILERRS